MRDSPASSRRAESSWVKWLMRYALIQHRSFYRAIVIPIVQTGRFTWVRRHANYLAGHPGVPTRQHRAQAGCTRRSAQVSSSILGEHLPLGRHLTPKIMVSRVAVVGASQEGTPRLSRMTERGKAGAHRRRISLLPGKGGCEAH